MKKYLPIAILLSATALSCKLFDKTAVRDITGVLPDSRVKFFNFAPSTPKLNFFAGETKMTSVINSTTAVDTFGIIYPTAASGGLYSGISAGATTFSARLATTTDNGLSIATAAQTIEKGKYYSYYLSGPYVTTTKTADSFIIEDPIPTAGYDDTTAFVRLVNAVSDGTGPLTLYAKNTTTLVEAAYGTATAYKGAGTFVPIREGVYDLSVRYTGSSTNVIALTGQTFVGRRAYTITSRGITATASTLGLTNTQNTR